MSEARLASALVPLALVGIMLALGLSLERSDFSRLREARAPLVAGLGGQLLLLPILGLLVARGSGLEPAFALGLVVLALSPGGALSNAISAAARADLALSVALTGCSSLVVPFTLPVFYGWAVRSWTPAGPALELPIAATVGQLVSVAIVPVVVGMAIRARYPGPAERLERPARVAAAALFFAVVGAIVVQNARVPADGIPQLVGPLLVLGAGATSIGLGLGVLLGLHRTATVTLGIEVGMQNLATATFVTATLLGDVRMALVPATYAFVMLPVAGLLALASRTRGSGDDRGALSGPRTADSR